MENRKKESILIAKVKLLSEKEKLHILSIFKKHNVNFTKNTNGYFFNLEKIDSYIIEKVIKCIDLIENKRDIISELDKKRDTHLEYYKCLIESKLKDNILLKNTKYINELILIPYQNDIIISKKNKAVIKSKYDGDPDILIKEYLKLQKYDKKSIYYKIIQTMKYNKRKRVNNNKQKVDNTSGNVEENEDNNNDDENEIEEHFEEVDNEKHSSEINEPDENDELDEADELHRVHNTSETEETLDDSDDDEIEEINSEDLDYYKHLLKQNGFIFDDDKNVIMIEEEYIY